MLTNPVSIWLQKSTQCVIPALSFVAMVWLIATPAWAFQATTSEPRQTPAPWRPSFGSINKSAQNAIDQNQNSGSPGSQSQAENQPLGQNLGQNSGQPFTNNSAGQAANNAPRIAPANVPQNALQSGTSNSGTNGQSNQSPPTQPRVASNPTKPGFTRVTKTMDKLPNTAGQIWREYDISPYTSQITTTDRPQKAITEWILRETGTEMWFDEPLGILHANKNQLLVYHTPEIHRVIKSIVDRFVRTRGQAQNLDVNLVTIEKPNWRSQYYTMLQPIDVKSAGVEAWMISKENAAVLLSQLSQRGDFKQASGGRLTNHDGQSLVLEKTKPVQFVRSLRWLPNQVPNYQPLLTSLDEGYRLSITTLSTMDNNSIEAVIKCDVDQVEKLTTVKVNVPGPAGSAQTMNLQVPQLVSWRLHERFRWPNDQVLLLSCGVVATPDPQSKGGLRLPGRSPKAKRADALLFVEYRGPATGSTIPQAIRPLQSRTAQNELAPLKR